MSKHFTSFSGLLALAILAMGVIVAMMAVQKNADDRQQASAGGPGAPCKSDINCRKGYYCKLPPFGGVVEDGPTAPTPGGTCQPVVPTNPPQLPPTTPDDGGTGGSGGGGVPAPTVPTVLACPSVSVTSSETRIKDNIFPRDTKVRVNCQQITGATAYRFYLWRIDSSRTAGGELYRVGADGVLKSSSAPYQLQTAGTYISQCSYMIGGKWSELKAWPKNTLAAGSVENAASVISDEAESPAREGKTCRVKFVVR